MIRSRKAEFLAARPIVGADVTLICGTSVTCGATRTDSKGEFTFRDLSPGDFTAHFNGPGFYSLDEPGYTIRARIESSYSPVYIERC
jgi:hypothetical protein